ncbi:MAG: 1,4-dihydroxy-2-naphthoyl-CoA hydrolase [Syntrophaceae bacterium PtaB.Bin095]|jgi:acyl-CoA thioester hydrolase|nr:MAG: 1,4-dihydroxy-2-naphthoyl-CoA hydrolase [Syntrophaceae bacterium PtaB.Bin095]
MGENKSFEIRKKVPFYDLDPMQIVWHGNYLNYFEDARRAMLDHMGVDLYQYYERTGIVFPIIRTATKHIYPLRYGDEFICKATLVDSRFKIVVDFEIRLAADDKVCARGRTEQVAVQAPQMEILLRVPEEIRAALGI